MKNEKPEKKITLKLDKQTLQTLSADALDGVDGASGTRTMTYATCVTGHPPCLCVQNWTNGLK